MFIKPIEKYCRFIINKLGVVNAGGTAMILHRQKSPSLLRRRPFQPHNSFDHLPLVKVNVLISKFAHTLLNIYSTLLYTFYWCLDWTLKTTSNVTCQHVPRSKSGSGLINWSRLGFFRFRPLSGLANGLLGITGHISSQYTIFDALFNCCDGHITDLSNEHRERVGDTCSAAHVERFSPGPKTP